MSNQAVDLFAAFATDEAAEERGVETQLPGAGDTLFQVARAFNPTYRRVFKRLYKAAESIIKSGGPAGEAKSVELEIELMARTILVGWKGAIPFKGEKLEYSVENAKKLLALKEFRAVVSRFAEDFDNFKVVKTDDDEKNFETTSDGTSGGEAN